jgi:hypothetical protein
MQTFANRPEQVFLLDDPELYEAIIGSIRGDGEPSGSGFAQGLRFAIADKYVHVLCMRDETGHPFTYLSLGQLAIKHNVSSIVAVFQCHSLVENLYPGDLAVVSAASALPYPALYKNRDPYAADTESTEHYEASVENLNWMSRFLKKWQKEITWQRNIPTVKCGYAKHPTWGGGLEPWAPEQFDVLRRAGIETLCEGAAGVYEARAHFPDIPVICLNLVRTTPSKDSKRGWNRNKSQYFQPVVWLIEKLITDSAQTLPAKANP